MSNSVQCRHCHLPIPSDSKYCPKCGKQIHGTDDVSGQSHAEKIICSSCGITNDGANKFCNGCGTPLEQSRQAVHVGSTRKQQQPKKNIKQKNNTVWIVVGIFALAVIVSVILEMRNAGVSGVQDKQVQPAESQPQSESFANSTVLQDIAALENTLKTDPNNSDVILHLANRLHDAKFYIRAIETYKKYIGMNPANADARVDLGICYFETGDSKSAVGEIEQALKIDPKHQMAMFNLGIIQLNSGNIAEAKKWFKQCNELDPASNVGIKAKELLQQH